MPSGREESWKKRRKSECALGVGVSVSGWLVPKTYYCSDEKCGYSGPVFVEVEADEADKFKRAINGDE
jgi:hypothetical protein